MKSRNVDPLSPYYSRQGEELTEHGRADGVKNYAEVLFRSSTHGETRNLD